VRRIPLLAALLPLLLAAVSTAGGQSESALRRQIGHGRSVERALGSAAARLGALERATARDVTILEGRVADAQAQLDRATAAADRAAAALADARARVARLRIRLGQVRTRLASLLRERYESDPPDLVTVVLNSHGFAQLLETLTFLHDVQQRDSDILGLVRRARVDAAHEQRVFTALTIRRRAAVAAVTRRRDALAQIADGLRARRNALARARAARLALLSRARSRRIAAEHALTRLIAARERAALIPGPGGPWAIPWPVVQCESGGQNLPPNSATASGYYQILDSTWRGLGGSTPHAYQASKAEQDRLAARLWAGGAGASNWVCAALVGAL
jgi:hypothetical protein